MPTPMVRSCADGIKLCQKTCKTECYADESRYCCDEIDNKNLSITLILVIVIPFIVIAISIVLVGYWAVNRFKKQEE